MIKVNQPERRTFRINQLVTCDCYPDTLFKVRSYEHGEHGEVRYTVRNITRPLDPDVSGLRPKNLNRFKY